VCVHIIPLITHLASEFSRKGVKRTAKEIADVATVTVTKRVRAAELVMEAALRDATEEVERGWALTKQDLHM